VIHIYRLGCLLFKDLISIEEAFERLMLDYDRVFSSMSIPACLWRRTGEIYKGNRAFAELVGVEGSILRDVSLLGRMANT
jgi:PAS domain-containing protein